MGGKATWAARLLTGVITVTRGDRMQEIFVPDQKRQSAGRYQTGRQRWDRAAGRTNAVPPLCFTGIRWLEGENIGFLRRRPQQQVDHRICS